MTDQPPTPGRGRRPPFDRDDGPPDYTVAVSPRQLAGGFAILAAILVLLVRRRGRGGAKRDG